MSLLYMKYLGLLPLVEKFRICNDDAFAHPEGFAPNRLKTALLPRFLALTNVRELDIERLNIPDFIPSIQRYFKNMLPTLRSLTLRIPHGSPRQILYFVGQFQHLEDFTFFLWFGRHFPEETAKDLTLVPPFTPPLRGRLTLRYIDEVLFAKTMIDLFGGIRSRHMDLYYVDGTSLLLGDCAERLETLRLYLDDPRSQQSYLHSTGALTNDFAVRSYLWDIGLSRHRSLQTFEVMAWSIDQFLNGGSPDRASRLLKHAISTITSSSFLKVTIRYQNRDICGILSSCHDPLFGLFVRVSQAERESQALRYHRHLEVFRGCQRVREFQLVLCAAVLDGVGEYSMRVLKKAVTMERARGVFEDFSSEPVVVHSPRSAVINDGDEFCTFCFRPHLPKKAKWQ